jgi:hypothetical protein
LQNKVQKLRVNPLCSQTDKEREKEKNMWAMVLSKYHLLSDNPSVGGKPP